MSSLVDELLNTPNSPPAAITHPVPGDTAAQCPPIKDIIKVAKPFATKEPIVLYWDQAANLQSKVVLSTALESQGLTILKQFSNSADEKTIKSLARNGPNDFALQLALNPQRTTYSGRVAYVITLKNPERYIVINAKLEEEIVKGWRKNFLWEHDSILHISPDEIPEDADMAMNEPENPPLRTSSPLETVPSVNLMPHTPTAIPPVPQEPQSYQTPPTEGSSISLLPHTPAPTPPFSQRTQSYQTPQLVVPSITPVPETPAPMPPFSQRTQSYQTPQLVVPSITPVPATPAPMPPFAQPTRSAEPRLLPTPAATSQQPIYDNRKTLRVHAISDPDPKPNKTQCVYEVGGRVHCEAYKMLMANSSGADVTFRKLQSNLSFKIDNYIMQILLDSSSLVGNDFTVVGLWAKQEGSRHSAYLAVKIHDTTTLNSVKEYRNEKYHELLKMNGLPKEDLPDVDLLDPVICTASNYIRVAGKQAVFREDVEALANETTAGEKWLEHQAKLRGKNKINGADLQDQISLLTNVVKKLSIAVTNQAKPGSVHTNEFASF